MYPGLQSFIISSAVVLFSVPGSTKLHNLISKLKKWIKILEARIKLLPKSFLIEEKCRFLSNFSQNTAEVEIPGEFLLPKVSAFSVSMERCLKTYSCRFYDLKIINIRKCVNVNNKTSLFTSSREIIDKYVMPCN